MKIHSKIDLIEKENLEEFDDFDRILFKHFFYYLDKIFNLTNIIKKRLDRAEYYDEKIDWKRNNIN